MPDHLMEEEMPGANAVSEQVLVSQGQFQGADEFHKVLVQPAYSNKMISVSWA
jgi:hypothetical protein